MDTIELFNRIEKHCTDNETPIRCATLKDKTLLVVGRVFTDICIGFVPRSVYDIRNEDEKNEALIYLAPYIRYLFQKQIEPTFPAPLYTIGVKHTLFFLPDSFFADMVDGDTIKINEVMKFFDELITYHAALMQSVDAETIREAVLVQQEEFPEQTDGIVWN